MKTKILLFAAILGLMNISMATESQPAEKDVKIGITGVYVPGGFDSSADAYVVVNGIFQNGCYKWKNAEVVHKTSTEHEVTSVASVSQGMCIMVLIPFQKDIHLGQLVAGKHTLRFLNGDGTYLEKTMNVE
ncbi:MAG: hypothetical protein WA160_14695 [Pseudobdellovibrio sp.]